MKILVLNAGSSSLKYQLFDMDSSSVLAKGTCERIGAGGTVTHKRSGAEPYFEEIDLPNHGVALERVLSLLTSKEYGVIASVAEGISVAALAVVSLSPTMVSAQAANAARTITITSNADVIFIINLEVITELSFINLLT